MHRYFASAPLIDLSMAVVYLWQLPIQLSIYSIYIDSSK